MILKNNKENYGVSMITLIITIMVIIILAGIGFGSSTYLIDKAGESKNASDANEDNDVIRALLTYSITDSENRIGIALSDSLVVLGSGDKEYGKGYYLIPGGNNRVLAEISEKTGEATVLRYKEITAPYVVDYDNGRFERILELRFKGE